jgi:hypothetical protein
MVLVWFRLLSILDRLPSATLVVVAVTLWAMALSEVVRP